MQGKLGTAEGEIAAYIDNLLASWPRRLRKVLLAKGDRIAY